VFLGTPSCEVKGTQSRIVSKVAGTFETTVRLQSGSSATDPTLKTSMQIAFASAFGIALETVSKFELSVKSTTQVQANSNLRRLDTENLISVSYEFFVGGAAELSVLQGELASFSWSAIDGARSAPVETFLQEMLKSSLLVIRIEGRTPTSFEDTVPDRVHALKPSTPNTPNKRRSSSIDVTFGVVLVMVMTGAIAVACCIACHTKRTSVNAMVTLDDVDEVVDTGKSVGIATRSMDSIRSWRSSNRFKKYVDESEEKCSSVPLATWEQPRHPNSCTTSIPLDQIVASSPLTDYNEGPSQILHHFAEGESLTTLQ